MTTHQRKVSVVGLGYVGLPVAVAFGKQSHCVGFDINEHRIAELKRGEDGTLEVEPADLKAANITFTAPQCPQCGGRPQRSFRRAKRGP